MFEISPVRVQVVIVNYRSYDVLVDCLESLSTEGSGSNLFAVTVVDNASGDGSVEHILRLISDREWDSWIDLIPLNENRGFSAGNNAGIQMHVGRRHSPEFIYLLNPDTLVSGGSIQAMVRLFDLVPSAGIVGSLMLNEMGGEELSARRCPSVWTQLSDSAGIGLVSWFLEPVIRPVELLSSPVKCDWVSGASMMIRQGVFADAGMFDEAYFLYFEELDFCERARRCGWEVWVQPGARIVHLEGASTGIGHIAARRPQYWFDSRRRFFLRRYGEVGLIVADVFWLVGRMLGLAKDTILGRSFWGKGPPNLVSDLVIGDLVALICSPSPGRFSRDCIAEQVGHNE